MAVETRGNLAITSIVKFLGMFVARQEGFLLVLLAQVAETKGYVKGRRRR
jgi:hypothetical protein